MIRKEPHWYTLNMLPLYLEMLEAMLTEAAQDLARLQDIKIESSYFSKDIIISLANKYYEHKINNWIFFEQCKRWRSDSPDDEALKLIATVEKIANNLDITNHNIVKLVENIQYSIID